MKQETVRRSLALFILLGCAIAALSRADQPPTTPASQPPAADQTTGASGPSGAPTPAAAPNGAASTSASQQNGLQKIVQLDVAPSGEAASENISLNDKLAVVLSQTPLRPADQYVLFLNGSEMKGLAPAIYTTLKNGRHALVFKLTRNKDNDTFWKELLGSPKRFAIPVTVGLGEPCSASQPCKSPAATITGDLTSGSFDFQLLSWTWLALASFGVAIVLFLVWGHARTRATLRDNLLPQLPPNLQPYSLARWQMSFWFVLIFASFLFLYILLWDYNTVSSQALALMGISAATGLAAVAVDAYKDSPADAVNRGLQALGLHNYDDVVRVKQELEDRDEELAQKRQAFDREPPVAPAQAGQAPPLPSPTAQRITQLQLEIQDRQNIMSVYESKTRPFVTQGWFKDITTDLNGTAIHRLQIVCWTVVLGLVFIVGVYRDLAMPPDFSATLLALMGISSAGYVGFKFPEKNN